MGINRDAVKSAAAGRWPDILRCLCPVVQSALDESPRHVHCPLPSHDDSNPSFRFDEVSNGLWVCSCGAGDGFTLLMQVKGWEFKQALSEVATYLGIDEVDKSQKTEPDTVAQVASDKRMPVDGIRLYGGQPAKRGKLSVVRFPVYNEAGVPHSHFDLAPGTKGWFAKGKGSSGLFLPGRIPQPGESWVIVEGAKDAAALSALGYLVCGTPNDHLAQKYVRLFQRVNVTIVPDRTSDAEAKAQISAKRLIGVAESVVVATLPLPMAESSDDPNDTRDVLKLRDGEASLRKAIDDAVAVRVTTEPPRRQRNEVLATDMGNAIRFAADHGDCLRYVHAWKKWIVWTGQRWQIDETGEVVRKAKETARNIFKEAANQRDDDKSKRLAAWAMKSQSVARIDAMLKLAKSELPFPISHEQLETSPWLFNCQNGTLDLHTGKLQPHNPDDLLLSVSPVEFDSDADCPTWMAFLETIMGGDKEMIRYLMRLVGYSMTGVIREHILPIMYGTGANGKSTFVNAIMSVMGGSYATAAPPKLLVHRKHEEHETQKTELFRRRFVAAMETERGDQLSESLVKSLTGGDPIKARRMREDFWQFMPTHKLWMATNYRPKVRGQDKGIWRRIKLIPFEVSVPLNKQDPELPKRLEAELPGILNWCVLGCLTWQEHGLSTPEAVSDATKQYQNESDYFGQFIAACCDTGSDALRCYASELFKAFQDWGGRMTQTAFGREMNARGYEKKKLGGRMSYVGIALENGS